MTKDRKTESQKDRRTVRYACIKDLKVGDGYGKQKSADFVKLRGCLTLNFGNHSAQQIITYPDDIKLKVTQSKAIYS